MVGLCYYFGDNLVQTLENIELISNNDVAKTQESTLSENHENTKEKNEKQTLEKQISDQSIIENDNSNTEQYQAIDSNIRYYGYETLSDDEKALYLKLYNCMINGDKELTLGFIGEDILSKLFSLCMDDHPEIFYVEGYQYKVKTVNGVTTELIFSPNYIVQSDQIAIYKAKIEQEIVNCMSGFRYTGDDYDTVKYFYDYIIENTDYNLNAEYNQEIYSVFVNKESVCNGYAKALQYLLQRNGIETFVVSGTANGDKHAWNLVKVNSNFYYVDPTWGDTLSDFADGTKPEGFVERVNYDYFLVTTEEINKTHFAESIVEIPNCESIKDNYFYRERLLIGSYDQEVLKEIFDRTINSSNRTVTIKCTNESVYTEVFNKLINEQEIFDYLNLDEGNISYSYNQELLTFSFWI